MIASLLGYGIFTSRPDLLVQVDPQARFFIWAFHGFAVGNMLFGGLAVVAEAVLRDRKRAMMALVAVYVVSLTSELLGTDLWGSFRCLFLHEPAGSEVVRPRAFAYPSELVHDELGRLDYRASQNRRISGGAIRDMPFSGLGPVAGSGHEQSNKLLDLG